MKTLRNNMYDVNTWHQVLSKIKHSDYDRQNENKDLIDRVRAAQSAKTDPKSEDSNQKK